MEVSFPFVFPWEHVLNLRFYETLNERRQHALHAIKKAFHGQSKTSTGIVNLVILRGKQKRFFNVKTFKLYVIN